jgi:aryl-alcohol dehydrogenase-like predicted oxidoreductase
MTMTKRALGTSGLSIAPLVLGGNVFGWTADEKTSFAVLDAFIDLGFNCIDTADAYSTWGPGNKGGESETIIGKWMKARKNRDRVVIVTKVGSEMGPGKKGLKPGYIAQAVEASLKRLGTDYIDLYLAHWPDPEASPEETMAGFGKVMKEGKARAIGASNHDAAMLKAAAAASRKLGVAEYSALQPHYNMAERKHFEGDLQKYCIDHKLGVITYFALAKGFLSGKYRSEADLKKSARGEGVAQYLNDRGFAILAALDKVSKAHSATQAQVALAWLMTRPGVTAPIASATTVEQVNDIAKSASLALSADDIAALDKASA